MLYTSTQTMKTNMKRADTHFSVSVALARTKTRF